MKISIEIPDENYREAEAAALTVAYPSRSCLDYRRQPFAIVEGAQCEGGAGKSRGLCEIMRMCRMFQPKEYDRL